MSSYSTALGLPSHVPATGLYRPSGMHPTSRRIRVSFRSGPPLRPTAPRCGPVYRRRRPTLTPLYPLVQHHLETFLAQAAELDPMGDGVPSWVERDFRDHASRGALCVVAFWHTDSHERGVPVVATTSWWRSPAEVVEHVRRVMPAVWSRPPPISSIMSCRRFRCGNGCSPFRSASGPSFTTTPRSPALCCATTLRAVPSYAPFGPRSEMRAREPVPVPTSARGEPARIRRSRRRIAGRFYSAYWDLRSVLYYTLIGLPSLAGGGSTALAINAPPSSLPCPRPTSDLPSFRA